MDAEKFSELLKNPALLSGYSLEELVGLSEEFPYSHAIYPLIVKKAQMMHHADFNTYLHKAAIHIADRKKLFELVHAELQNGKVHPEKADSIKEPVSAKEAEPEVFQIEVPETEKMRETTEIIPAQLAEEKAPPKKKQEKEKGKKKKEKRGKTKEERTQAKTGGAKKKEEPLIAKKKTGVKKKVKQEPDKIPPKANRNETSSSKNTVQTSDKHTFTEWLKYVKGEGISASGELPWQQPDTALQPKEEEEKKINIPKSAYGMDLRTNRKIKTTPEEEEAVSRLASESISSKDKTVTETLAKVLEAQKKYDKAINVYEKLILQYPDKKAYFAQKIQTLKGKL